MKVNIFHTTTADPIVTPSVEARHNSHVMKHEQHPGHAPPIILQCHHVTARGYDKLKHNRHALCLYEMWRTNKI